MTATRRVTSRLSSRSQTVIPKPIRDRLGIGPGDLIAFEERAGEIVIRPVQPPLGEDPFATFTEWAGAEDEEAYAGL
ncbi:MAG: AbrB/MazE/SpoVT family DNA-binding domain-containing protein [Geminicoccaceae bacterium]